MNKETSLSDKEWGTKTKDIKKKKKEEKRD